MARKKENPVEKLNRMVAETAAFTTGRREQPATFQAPLDPASVPTPRLSPTRLAAKKKREEEFFEAGRRRSNLARQSGKVSSSDLLLRE